MKQRNKELLFVIALGITNGVLGSFAAILIMRAIQ